MLYMLGVLYENAFLQVVLFCTSILLLGVVIEVKNLKQNLTRAKDIFLGLGAEINLSFLQMLLNKKSQHFIAIR